VRGIAAAAGLVVLCACPIPQAVPEVGLLPNGSLVPAPRIVPERVQPSSTFIDISRACPAAPRITFQATISEFDVSATPEARWFVDYDPVANSGVQAFDRPAAPPGASDTYRSVAPFTPPALALRWQDPTVGVQVVELVVSNGFLPPGDARATLPNRTPQPTHETQVFRWVIRYLTTGGVCSVP